MRKLRLFRRKSGQKDTAQTQLEEEISHTQQTAEWTAPQPGEEDHTQPAEEWMAPQLEKEADYTQPAQEWTVPQPEETDHTQPAEEWIAPQLEEGDHTQPAEKWMAPQLEEADHTQPTEEDDRTVPAAEWNMPEEAEHSGGSVECRGGIYAGAVIPLDQELVIGRDETCCNLVVKGAQISRKHCSVGYDGQKGAYVVTDFSSNGIFDQNGTKFPQNIPVICGAGTVFSIAQSGNEFLLK